MTELQARLAFWKTALEKKRAAYLALLDGGVKSYTIDDRSLTRFDLDTLAREIKEDERRVDELTTMVQGGRPRRAVGIVPRNW
jgi:hypothetical protein